MKVHTRVVWQMTPEGMVLLEDEGYEWEGEVAMALGGGGDAPKPAGLPKFQKPFVKDLLARAETEFQTGGPETFTGQRVADLNAAQLGGIQGAQQFAAGGAQSVADQAQQGFTFGLNAADPQANPFFASTAQALINPLADTLQQQILPGIDSGAVQAGQVGSSRQGIAQGNAINSFNRAASDALAKFGSNAFGQGLNTFTQTLAQAPSVQGVGLQPSQILSGTGDVLNQQQQALINANLEQFTQEQNRSVNNLNQFAGIAGANFNGSGAIIPGSPESGGIAGALGGAALGGTLGAAIPGFGAGAAGATGLLALGPAGAVGLGLGALAGFFA